MTDQNRILATALGAVAAMGIAGSISAQPAPEPVRNVVLVHGAFADGSGWRGVYDELTGRGYRVTVAQNPLTSLVDDVAATNRALDRQDGPAVLVGHSWGGTVITEAGVHPKVASLVYVSALAPDAGETTSQQYEGHPAAAEFVLDTRPDGFGFIDASAFKTAFAADASDADAAFMRDAQVPIAMSAFGETLTNAAWRTRPSWAVIATEDKAFGDGMLHAMARRIGARITEVRASHALFMTQPKVIADVIDEAARHGAPGTK
jgi:pimeloyl-ACP methyl ester carboxylesterase